MPVICKENLEAEAIWDLSNLPSTSRKNHAGPLDSLYLNKDVAFSQVMLGAPMMHYPNAPSMRHEIQIMQSIRLVMARLQDVVRAEI